LPWFTFHADADGEEIEHELDEEDDNDNAPVFADFFQRLRDIEAELDLIEARGRFEK
jgi:hypothetical protein